tara:strand:+ start:414 stop:914 length:501 start_codon:yes stop_codon:yes gene_type:complete
MNKNQKNKLIMDEIKIQAGQIIPNRKKHRADNQMTLGSLIKALSKERTGLPVLLSSVYQGYVDKYPGTPHSYYGYPEDLAFTASDNPITVAKFITVCETSIGNSFPGPDHANDYYRDYIMQVSTPVWISEIDTATKNGVIDVISNASHVTLVTKEIKEEVDDAIKP